jgi:hypothetical protein
MEEAAMRRKSQGFVAVATAVGATVGIASLGAGQTAPPMGGGYTNPIPIPVNDPTTKEIAGALFRPPGAEPFPAVIYMVGCGGLVGLQRWPLKRLLSIICAQEASPR